MFAAPASKDSRSADIDNLYKQFGPRPGLTNPKHSDCNFDKVDGWVNIRRFKIKGTLIFH